MANIENPFQTEISDTLYIFNQLAKHIKINDNPDDVQAILTHTATNTSFDDYKITTLSFLQRGDLIEYDNKKYLVISEVNDTRRSKKYRAIMRYLPFHLHVQTGSEKNIIGWDELKRPIYKETPIYTDIDCFVQNQPQVQFNNSQVTYTGEQFYIVAKDDENSQKIELETKFELIGRVWSTNYIDLSKRGLRIFKLNSIASP